MHKSVSKLFGFFQTRFDILFFYLFLTTSTLSIRKVLYYFPVNNSFNEYTGVYIYLSDIFLILTFISYILCNINTILSMLNSFNSFIRQKYSNFFKLFHVEQFDIQDKTAVKSTPILIASVSKSNSFRDNENILIVPRGTIGLLRKTYTHIINNYLTFFPLFMVFFSFISILWTTNQTIALYRSIKLLEFILLYFYIISIVPRGTIEIIGNQFSTIIHRLFHVEQSKVSNHEKLKPICTSKNIINCSTWNNTLKEIVPRGTILENSVLIIITAAVIQSIIGIIQFILQHSIGLSWLKESIISPTTPGVAKIILHVELFIRSYGLFPHPNILGGYLVITIILTILSLKLNCSTWNNTTINSSHFITSRICQLFHVEQLLLKRFVLNIVLIIQLFALILTFSKSAIFGLLLGLFYIYYHFNNSIVPRGTMHRTFTAYTIELAAESFRGVFKLFHVEQFKKKHLLICAILILSFIIIKPDIYSLLLKSLQEREFYLNVSRGTILSHPFIGVGAGQFIFQLLDVPLIQDWQFQPVHNVLLLILNEYGIFIFSGFVLFLYKIFNRGNCSTWNNSEENIFLLYLKGILLSFIFIMLFDHYFWDIQQGQIILWLFFAFIVNQQNQTLINDTSN